MIKESSFKASWWQKNKHLQTLWGPLFRKEVKNIIRKERFEISDGDFVDLYWTSNDSGPIIIFLHGLAGSYMSHYMPGILNVVSKMGWRGLLLHFRGCSGEPNRLARGYHEGDTEDLSEVVQTIRKLEPQTPIAAVGYSMGGNVLLKWLGCTGKTNPLCAGIAISPTFDLHIATNQLEKGFSRIYQKNLINQLIGYIKMKSNVTDLPIDTSNIENIRTFRQFDAQITAPLHGFKDIDEYYNESSCRKYIKDICIPTLILHSRDDPFSSLKAIPSKNELSPKTTLELSKNGGHVGFVSGMFSLNVDYWLERRIPEYLSQYIK